MHFFSKGIREGDTVSVFYDPMIAKLITWDTNRERAMQQVRNRDKDDHEKLI